MLSFTRTFSQRPSHRRAHATMFKNPRRRDERHKLRFVQHFCFIRHHKTRVFELVIGLHCSNLHANVSTLSDPSKYAAKELSNPAQVFSTKIPRNGCLESLGSKN